VPIPHFGNQPPDPGGGPLPSGGGDKQTAPAPEPGWASPGWCLNLSDLGPNLDAPAPTPVPYKPRPHPEVGVVQEPEEKDEIQESKVRVLMMVATSTLQSFVPGDWILVRDFRRKHWKCRRWTGTYQIVLVTHTSFKIAERVSGCMHHTTRKLQLHLASRTQVIFQLDHPRPNRCEDSGPPQDKEL
ncbi:hypothetical protein CRENBAI_018394, partial [Crenichthys baileyi]